MGVVVEVTALAINVAVPEELQWTDSRRGETFRLTALNVRLRPDGHLAAKAYGRPFERRSGHLRLVQGPGPAGVDALIVEAADRAGSMWAAHGGLD